MSDVYDAQGAQEEAPAAGEASLPSEEPGAGWATFAMFVVDLLIIHGLIAHAQREPGR